MEETLKEIRLRQLEQVNQKIENTTDLNELAKLEATGRFLISLINKNESNTNSV